MAIARIQTVSASGAVTFAAANAGNLLVLLYGTEGTAKSTPDGWTLAVSRPIADSWRVLGCFYKFATGGETSIDLTGGDSANRRLCLIEYAGVLDAAPLTTNSRSSISAGSDGPYTDVTPAADLSCLIVGMSGLYAFTETLTTRAGFEERDQSAINSPTMGVQMMDQIVSDTTGSAYRLGSTYSGNRFEGAIAAVFEAAPDVPDPVFQGFSQGIVIT